MIPSSSIQRSTTNSLDLEGKSAIIGEESHGLIMEALIQFYQEPFKAVPRELISNAWDAAQRIGVQAQINIHTAGPLAQSKFVVISDNGSGMSAQTIEENFVNFGMSDKRNTNDETGFQGYGAKVPLAITPTFTVTSRDGNRITQTTLYLDENNIIKYNTVDHGPTDERGTTLYIPLASDEEIEKFNQGVRWAAFGFPSRTVYLNGISLLSHEDNPTLSIDNNVFIFDKDTIFSRSFNLGTNNSFNWGDSGRLQIIQGGNIYPLDNINPAYNNLPFDTYIEVPNGTFMPTPQRDQLRDSQHNIQTLDNIINNQLQQQLNTYLENNQDSMSYNTFKRIHSLAITLGFNLMDPVSGLTFTHDLNPDSLTINGSRVFISYNGQENLSFDQTTTSIGQTPPHHLTTYDTIAVVIDMDEEIGKSEPYKSAKLREFLKAGKHSPIFEKYLGKPSYNHNQYYYNIFSSTDIDDSSGWTLELKLAPKIKASEINKYYASYRKTRKSSKTNSANNQIAYDVYTSDNAKTAYRTYQTQAANNRYYFDSLTRNSSARQTLTLTEIEDLKNQGYRIGYGEAYSHNIKLSEFAQTNKLAYIQLSSRQRTNTFLDRMKTIDVPITDILPIIDQARQVLVSKMKANIDEKHCYAFQMENLRKRSNKDILNEIFSSGHGILSTVWNDLDKLSSQIEAFDSPTQNLLHDMAKDDKYDVENFVRSNYPLAWAFMYYNDYSVYRNRNKLSPQEAINYIKAKKAGVI